MDLEQLLKYFSSDKITQSITQLKATPRFLTENIFKEKVPCLENMATIKIIKGSGVVLSSVSENGEHLIEESKDAYILKIPLPRFPIVKTISASEVNSLRTLSLQQEQVKSLAAAINTKIKDAKESFITTLEYMSAGALFGKIMDGNSNILFEFGNKDKPKVVLKNTDQSLRSFIDDCEEKVLDEFGASVDYEVFCGNDLFGKLNDKVLEEGLFKNNLAFVDKDKTLSIYGVKFRRYSAKYKNQKGKNIDFLESSKAIVVPKDGSSKIYYGRANHIDAVNKAPTLMFVSKPEILNRGRGIEITAEMRAIPVCTRPNGLIEIALA